MGLHRCSLRWLPLFLLILSTAARLSAQSTSNAEIIKQAESGNVKAQLRLGDMYASGRGLQRDEAKATRWYREAAEQGLAEAELKLGWMYHDGLGVPKDLAQTASWFRKAAEQGLARAQCDLGYAYANGEGVSKDVAEAARWYRMAAEQGNALAQYNLGLAYHNGEGVQRDEAEADRWVRKAAGQGLAAAQAIVGKNRIEQEAQPTKNHGRTVQTNTQGLRGVIPSFLGFAGGQSRATVEANAQAQGFESLNCESSNGNEECSSSRGLGDDNVMVQFTFVHGKLGKMASSFPHARYQFFLATTTKSNGTALNQKYDANAGGTDTSWADKEKDKYVILSGIFARLGLKLLRSYSGKSKIDSLMLFTRLENGSARFRSSMRYL